MLAQCKRIFNHRIHHPDPLVDWKLNTFYHILTRGLIPLMIPFLVLSIIYRLWWMALDVSVLIGFFCICVLFTRKTMLRLSVNITAVSATVSDLTLLFFLHITDSLYYSVLIIILVGIFLGRRWVFIWTVLEISILIIFSLLFPEFRMLPSVLDSSETPAGYILTGTYFMSACLLYVAGAYISILFWRLISELLVVKAQLVQTQKLDSLGFFAASVTHEWNHGLTRIKSCAKLILKKTDESMDELRIYAKSIIDCCIHITDASVRLLAFTRKPLHENCTIQIHDLLETTTSLLAYLVEKKIRLTTQFNAKYATTRGDCSQLQIVLMNLAVNATTAMPDGGTLRFSTRNIDYSSGSDKPYLNDSGSIPTHIELSVEDSGIGMDTETINRLFTSFNRNKKETGTGLGLPLVKRLVLENNGSISVSSEVNKGTVFRIKFPLARLRKESVKSDILVEKRTC